LRAVVAGGRGAIGCGTCAGGPGSTSKSMSRAQQRTKASADVSLAPNGLRMLKRFGVGEGTGRVAARHLPAQLLLSGGLPARHQPH